MADVAQVDGITLFARVLLPAIGVWVSVALLVAAVVVDFVAPHSPWTFHLFTWGLISWFAGVAWGVWINGRPLPLPATVEIPDAR